MMKDDGGRWRKMIEDERRLRKKGRKEGRKVKEDEGR
jgi:hypothetical protein